MYTSSTTDEPVKTTLINARARAHAYHRNSSMYTGSLKDGHSTILRQLVDLLMLLNGEQQGELQ